MSKFINIDKLDKLAKALDNRVKLSVDELRILIEEVREMLGGRSLVYLTQAEYDALLEGDKFDQSKMYIITDAEEFDLEELSATFQTKEDENLTTSTNSVVGGINEVYGMLGGRSIVYITQFEYDALPESEQLDPSKAYVITDATGINANTIGGYSVWVGTSAELEGITERDPNTIYFELEDEEDVIQDVITDNQLVLTKDKYQKATLTDGVTIVFPTVEKFTEIHLYFNTGSNININLDGAKVSSSLNIEAGKSYEMIAIYNTIEWLVDIKVYN